MINQLSAELNSIMAQNELTLNKTNDLRERISCCEARLEYVQLARLEGYEIAQGINQMAQSRVQHIDDNAQRVIGPLYEQLTEIEKEIALLAQVIPTEASEERDLDDSSGEPEIAAQSLDYGFNPGPRREYSLREPGDLECGEDVPQVIPVIQTEAVSSTEPKREYSLREPCDLECGEDELQVIPVIQTEAVPSTEPKREFSLREPHDLEIPSDGLEINVPEPDEPDMRFEAFVDGRHYETVAGQISPIHDHCWQVKIAVEVPTNNPHYASYGKVFKAINSTLARYEDVLLNEVFPFELIEPSLDNVAMYFFNCLDDTLCLMDLIIKEITVWENSDSCLKVNSRNRAIDGLLYKGEDLLEDIRSRLNAQDI